MAGRELRRDGLAHDDRPGAPQQRHDRRIARVQTTVAGRKFLERSRSRKDLYLSSRIRTLDSDDRAVLARAAVILEKLLEGESQ